jgi:hypothetical protein
MGIWRRTVGRLDGWTTWGTSGLADEATAFLEGRLLESQRATGAGGRVPPWLWRAALARELLERSGGDADLLADLQRRALVPLECGLTEVPDLTPARLHEIVLTELWLTES